MALVLADGQLAATVGTILAPSRDERFVAVMLANTAEQSQQVTMLLLRAGSTARRLVRGKLLKDESCQITGIPIDPSDTLQAYADGGSAVDYTVTMSVGQFSVTFRDGSGAPKTSQAIEVTLPESGDLTADGVKVSGLLEEVRDVLLKIA